MNHTQPNERPIHAECDMIDDAGKMCSCDEAWDYWDGTTKALDRAIAVAMQQEGRSRAAIKGHGADRDEVAQGGRKEVMDKGYSAAKQAEGYMGGFWSHAQDLKCRRGDKMRPLVYAEGATWMRAKAEEERFAKVDSLSR